MSTVSFDNVFKALLRKAGVELDETMRKVVEGDDFKALEIPTSLADPVMKLVSLDQAAKIKEVKDAATGELLGILEKAMWQDARDRGGMSSEEWAEFKANFADNSTGKVKTVDLLRGYLPSVHESLDKRLEELKGSDIAKVREELEGKFGDELSRLKSSVQTYEQKITAQKSEFENKLSEAQKALFNKDRTHYLQSVFSKFTLTGPAKEDPSYRGYLFDKVLQKVNNKALIRQDETGAWGAYNPSDKVSSIMDEKNNILSPKDLIEQELAGYIDPTGGKGGQGGPGGGGTPPPKPKPPVVPQNGVRRLI